MTDGQVKYQTLMENQRHNYEMERFAKSEAESKSKQAEASMMQAEASKVAAETGKSQAKIAAHRWVSDVVFGITGFILPDANTAAKVGGQVVSALFG